MASQSAAQDTFLSKKVASLRLKLLDLSGRNALLSFRHRARSRKMIRVVDEVPDLLVERLGGESAFQFQSLNFVRQEPADERTQRFRRALRDAELSDATYQEALVGLGDDPSPKALERLDLELRIRVRAKLGMSARGKESNPSIDQIARSLGIEPSFDLPSQSVGGADKHTDRFLQTLLDPEELEKTLSGVYGQYRSSLDELGVNTLFMIVGFLEWYESSDSETPLHAPLLMLPLEMSREAVRGRFVSTIAGVGEAPQTNITLRERLKRDFQIVLPEFDEDSGSPEQYFNQIHTVIKDRPHWKVRRWVTVAHLGFARMAMFHDLADAGWSSSDRSEASPGVHNQSVVRRILGGVGSDGSERPTPPVDPITPTGDRVVEGSPETRSRPRVVLDADSSQVAAILDALDGHDLVVEGPPGTGKSQTIANLIAAAIAEGKSVLFVAEKMAALRVVHDRLKKVGLEPFCLELHSNRAKRKDVAASFKRRLDLAPHREQLRDTEDEAERVRSELSAYCRAINGPACRLGVSIHEALWRIDRLRQQSEGAPASLEQFDPGGADEWTMDDIDARIAAMSRVVAARGKVSDDASSLKNHPWRGLATEKLSPFEAEELAELMDVMKRDASVAVDLAARLCVHASTPPDSGLPALVEVARPLADLPETPAAVDQRLWTILGSPSGRRQARALLDRRRDVRSARRAISERFQLSDGRLTALQDGLERLTTLAGQVAALSLGAHDDVGRREEVERRRGRAVVLQDASARIASFANSLGVTAELSPERVGRLKSIADVLSVAPPGTAHGRHPALHTPDATRRLNDAINAVESFRDRQRKVEDAMRTDTGEEPLTLGRHAAVLRRGGLFARFRRDFREARDCYLRLTKTNTRQFSPAMADCLLALADLIQAERKVVASDILAELYGDPIRSDIATARRALAVSQWLDRVRSDLTTNDGDGLAERLLTGSPESFQSMVAALPPAAAWEIARSLSRPIAIEAEDAATSAKHTAQFVADMAALPVPPSMPGADLPTLVALVRRVRDAESDLSREPLDTTLVSEEHSGRTISEECLETAIRHSEVIASVCQQRTVGWLLSEDTPARTQSVQEIAASLLAAAERMKASLTRLKNIEGANVEEWLGLAVADHAKPAHIGECAHRASTQRASLHRLIDLRRAERDLRSLGCGRLLGLLEQANVEPATWPVCIQRALLRTVVKRAVQASHILRDLDENRLDQLRRRYAELDRDQMQANARRLFCQLSGKWGEPGKRSAPRAEWTERALLELEANKQKRHIPLRRLFQQAGDTAKALMPCFLMSPLSVAQFLPAGSLTFDLVVMDEASQLRPEDALGAIARARQVVIVGDPKQLPPTNFFVSDNQPANSDDDEMQQEEDESILDAAAAVLPVRRRLLWHYRSRHPSLIRFSNSTFYDQSLILFPSSNEPTDALGVRYEHVADGCFSARVNLPEARRMVDAAISFLRQHPSMSLGLVTTNQPQQVLVAEELERRMTEIPEAAEYMAEWGKTLEPLFVKNLENVQGDERDAILVSTVYGRNDDGHLFQRFGPINSQVGHRRLNVLFTRAKRYLCVFSSLTPDDIRVDETSSRGVKALRDFLSYAKTGQLSGTLIGTREPDSEFEVSVAQRLEALGWEVEKQVGVAGYFIDLAVRHPSKPGRFVLGIECDGSRYHSAKSVRDRDRLRQQVLEDLGWSIARVWSLDWYRDPTVQVRRLDAQLKDLCSCLYD